MKKIHENTILEEGHRKLGKGKQVIKDAGKAHLRIGVLNHLCFASLACSSE